MASAPGDHPQERDLVVANRVLVAHGVLDAFGHVSLRRDSHAGGFLLSRNLAPELVTEADLAVFDLQAGTQDERPQYLERFIHSEILRARPDVNAVVHSHSPAAVAFSVSPQPLRPVIHMAGFLGAAAPVFEIRSAAGDGTNLLIEDADLGQSLAQCLGGGAYALMRGHGSVAVGATLQEAVYRAVYAEVNARVQLSAVTLGGYEPLSEAEGRAITHTMGAQIRRAWEVWSLRATPDPPAVQLASTDSPIT